MTKEEKKEYLKKWCISNREKRNGYSRKWYLNNKQKRRKSLRKYQQVHKDEGAKRVQKYAKTIKGKQNSHKHDSKRRQLGFFPLNKYFEGSEAHHISKNFVIYMPIELHHSLYHNVWTWQGMEQINKLAIEWL